MNLNDLEDPNSISHPENINGFSHGGPPNKSPHQRRAASFGLDSHFWTPVCCKPEAEPYCLGTDWEHLLVEIPATLSPHHSHHLTFMLCNLPSSLYWWHLFTDFSSSFISCRCCFNLDYIWVFISNIFRLCIQRQFPTDHNY